MIRPSHVHERSKAMLCNVWSGGRAPLCPPWPLNPSWLKWVADVKAPLCVQTEGALCFIGFRWMTGRRDRNESRVLNRHYRWLIRYATNTNADVRSWSVSAVWLLIMQKLTLRGIDCCIYSNPIHHVLIQNLKNYIETLLKRTIQNYTEF